MGCLQCFASKAYSCFSRTALTSLAVLKVVISIAIIAIVAIKLEDVRIELQLPVNSLADLTTIEGLANVTSNLMSGSSGDGSGSAAAFPPAATGFSPSQASPSPVPSDASGSVDLNTTAGPLHVDAACLLRKKGSVGQLDLASRTMCSYVFGVCAISLFATLIMTTLLWCTCHLCGWGPMLEVTFALLGTVWWLVAALVLQENTNVSLNAAPAAVHLIVGNAQPPPPAPASMRLLLPPPASPLPLPSPLDGGGSGDLASEVQQLLQSWAPRSVQQWRQAVVIMSWVMVGMWTASAVLLLVEACGCLLDCCGCLCRGCCPDRPESAWREKLRQRQQQRRKRMAGEEYIEMCGGVSSSTSSGGGAAFAMSPAASPAGGGGGAWGGGGERRAPGVLVVARSDGGEVVSPGLSSGGYFEREKDARGRRGWWR